MNNVFIVPTGIGAEIGGHNGDASPAAKLIASISDNFITHPNVFNASDINEMPENTWYVEGSMLDNFLEGKHNLKSVYRNKILVVANAPLKNEIVNSVSAARTTIGLDASILTLNTPLKMIGKIINGKADGEIFGWKELIKQVNKYDFDALAITTPIEVDRETKFNYYRNGGVNPWGRVEAIASKLIANVLKKPVAHAPADTVTVEDDSELYFFNEIVDPRISAEMVSVSYLHCILKGLHKAPQISNNIGLSIRDITALITPINCVGRPHVACMKANIPIIAVKENKTVLNDKMPNNFIVVKNYLEAAGVLLAIKSGISIDSIKRPLQPTSIYK